MFILYFSLGKIPDEATAMQLAPSAVAGMIPGKPTWPSNVISQVYKVKSFIIHTSYWLTCIHKVQKCIYQNLISRIFWVVLQFIRLNFLVKFLLFLPPCYFVLFLVFSNKMLQVLLLC